MSKILYCLLAIIMLTALVFEVITLVFLVYPYNPLEIKNPLAVKEKIVLAGDLVHYTLDFCKHTDKEGTLSKQLVNDYTIAFPPINVNAPEGCAKMTASALIPEYAPSGTYKMMLTATYQMNIWRTISVHFETEEFQVVGK